MSSPWLSTDSLLSAWRHVEENGGCAGADGITITRFSHTLDQELASLQHAVEMGTYRSLPLLPIKIQKKPNSNEIRTLLVPAIRDRILQTVLGRQLGRAFEDEFLECSFAYRPKRSVNSAIARIRYLHRHGYRFVVEADIDSFFDRIDHALLRERLAKAVTDAVILKFLEQWIAGPVWDGHHVGPLRRGIPQGSPISPLLANLFLSDFDLALEQRGLKLIRYADDFLLLSEKQDEISPSIAIASEKLETLHLRLKSGKTKIGTFDQGFQFLGTLFLGEGIWIPWEKHGRNRRVLAVPHPMPSALVRRWLEPPQPTLMARALASAGIDRIGGPNPGSEKEEEMAYLYLIEQGSVLRKIGNRLVVEKDGMILLDTPYHKLEAVLLFGNVQVTTQALAELLDCRIRLRNL
jgi:group II intron reverse transcriptase/maturase